MLYICGVVPYVVLSGSMEPTIETGSLCFIQKHVSYKSIKEKDIIAFRLKDGTLVTHRVIKVDKDGVVTKGDHNKDIDGGMVTSDTFVGKNIFWIPKIGYVVVAFQSTTGKIILLACVILLFVAGFLFGDDKEKKKN